MIFNINQGETTDFSKATAMAKDVVSGKTFYAGDNQLKTGTLIERSFNNGKITIPAQTFGTNHTITIECGFTPTKVYVERINTSYTRVEAIGYIDSGVSATLYTWNTQGNTFSGNGTINIIDNGFTIVHSNNNAIYDVVWCAIKE